MRKVPRPAPAASTAAFLFHFLACSGAARAAEMPCCGVDKVDDFIHAGPGGVSDVVPRPGDESESPGPDDLASSCLDRRPGGLHLELLKDGGPQHRMRLRAKGKPGASTLDGRRCPVPRDRER